MNSLEMFDEIRGRSDFVGYYGAFPAEGTCRRHHLVFCLKPAVAKLYDTR